MSRIAFAAVALTAAGYTVSAQAADLYGSRPYPNYTVNRVLDDVVRWSKPVWAEVKGEFRPRGGISTVVVARWPRAEDGRRK